MNKKVFLYCRVSSAHQGTGLEAQVRALTGYCQRNEITDYVIYQDENQSGIKNSRPGLDTMMAAIRKGECRALVVYSFSRYARSVTHLLRALEELKTLNVAFISTTEVIDTSSPIGAAVFTILGAVSQLERDILIERVKNGLANAKAKGVKLGRQKTRPSEMIRILIKKGQTYRTVSSLLGISSGAVSSEVRQMKKEIAEGKLDPNSLSKSTLPKGTSPTTIPDPEPKVDLEITRY